MRELRIVGLALAVALMVLPGVSWGVELDTETCETYAAFNIGGTTLGSILTLLHVTGVPTNWAVWDYELIEGEDGDGILDQWQMAILAAVICADAKEGADLSLIQGQYQTNLGLVDGVVDQLGDLADQIPRAIDLMVGNAEADPPVTGIIPGLSAIPEIQGVTTDWPDAGDTLADSLVELSSLMDDVGGYVGYLSSIVTAFNTIGPWMAGMGGLSTEMQDRVDDLMGEVTGFFGDFSAMGALLEGLLYQYGPGGVVTPDLIGTELAAEMTEMAELAQTIGVTIPEFVIYGSAGKTADEPLSALGDFDDDGVSNLVVYQGIVASGGGIADFVAAATGSNPFWPGNPNLPVAGLLGLGVMAGALVTGGAFKLRKRS